MSEAPQNIARVLVSRIGNGDEAAEDELVRTYLPRVLAFVCARTQDRDLANELGQEVMLAVLCALREHRLRDPDSLAGFVYGIARNLLNDWIRTRAQEKLDPLPPDFEYAQACPNYEESDRVSAAHRAIDTLDPADRRILLMTLVDGLKPGDIAEAVGMTSVVVRQRKSRALKKVIGLVRGASRNPGLLRLNRVNESK
jgi:RNA polymerase sigma-70 factor, ECF subfamily